jgi:hypothetical protein
MSLVHLAWNGGGISRKLNPVRATFELLVQLFPILGGYSPSASRVLSPAEVNALPKVQGKVASLTLAAKFMIQNQ